MLTPPNISAFYTGKDAGKLYQGDIISRSAFPTEPENGTYPSFGMIITKSCDLAITEQQTTRHENVSLLPLYTLNLIESLFQKGISGYIKSFNKNFLLAAVWNISKALNISALKASALQHLLKNEISKFMYLPPDGTIFQEPMIIDFDLVFPQDGGDKEIVAKILNNKVLQLSSPFREKVAQRFAAHFATIGIDDDYIRTKDYLSELKSSYEQSS